MPDTEIIQKVTEITGNAGNHESHINSLVLSMIDLNEDTFERTLSNAIFKIGFEKTVTHILYPFLEKVGVLWQIGSINPAQEHFIVSLIRQKLIVAIDAQESKPLPGIKTFLLFLPEKELHELGLLFYSYLLKKNGFRVIYLGQSVPFDDLIEVLKIRNADYLLTYFVAALAPEEIPDYLNKISRSLPDKKIWITGIQTSIQPLKHPPNVLIIRDVESFKELISKIH
ncbi:MAG: helix-turn-helix-type transcriptional regulator [Candidatus Moranbacteria bacterium]|nr:helix-turn-helix-type transcriptional regulator [Candidatus Moranbacteria bacterium]